MWLNQSWVREGHHVPDTRPILAAAIPDVPARYKTSFRISLGRIPDRISPVK